MSSSVTTLPLTSIRLFPVTTGVFDPSKAPKDWAMPPDCHIYDSPDDPDFVVFDIIVVNNYVPSFARKMFSRETAISSNPLGAFGGSSGQKLLPAVPVPIDKTKIPEGWSLGTGLLGVAALIPPVPASPEVNDHDAIMEILAYVRRHT